MLNGLDLFSGIGGITLGLAEWVRPVAYCECDRYAQGVLLSWMHEGTLPLAPIWDDVRTLEGSLLYTRPDIIYGGFPCQDISVAGAGKGLAGERSGLFFEIARLTSELRPDLVFLENVPAITTRGGVEVVGAFTSMGYDCRWCIIPSGHSKDGFKGERFFLLAKAKGARLQAGCEPSRNEKKCPSTSSKSSNAWMEIPVPKVQPEISGTTDGIPCRVDRIKCLGNAVVPQQVRKAFEILSGLNVNFHEA